MVSLLERMSANISYALDNFDREAARQSSERALRRLNRMFGAISATNDASLRAKTAQELYQLVCDAAVHSGESIATVVLRAEPDSIWLKPFAGTGEIVEQITQTRFSIDPDNVYGTGVCGKAFRTQKPCINHDILNSVQGRPWQQAGLNTGVVACVAFPLIKAGNSVGVLMFFVSKSWAADNEIIALLARMAENVSFALDNFERADEKAKADEQKERLTRMFAALSSTNEAIMRAKTRVQLFELVCEAAVLEGTFTSATIALADPDGEFLRIAASKGINYDRMRNRSFAVSATDPEGRGLTGTSFRTKKTCIMNDFLADERATHWHALAREDGTRSGASFPLLENGGRAVGVLLFLSREEGAFSDDLVELLGRLAENVSFALDNFDRAEEKAKTEEQKERLTRMFAALSATNEAIMRAKSRTQLFEMVCEAAANGGKFTSTTISLANPDSDFLDIAAVAGPTAETTRNVKVSISAARPEGNGLSGPAFRSGQARISNDYLADQQASAFHAVIRSDGAKSGAAFPLLIHGQPVGVMLF